MKNESGFIPTGDKVLVLVRQVEEKTAGGIVLPKIAQEKEQVAETIGTLLAVAPELEGVHLGDDVLFARYSGVDFPVEGKKYRIMRVQDVVGKVTKLPDFVMKGAKSSVESFGFNEGGKPQQVVAA